MNSAHADWTQRNGGAMFRRTMKIEVRRRRMAGLQFLAETVDVASSLVAHLNLEVMAVLAVIRDDANATGRCTLPLAQIAERANIGRVKARASIRLAESLGVIAIEHAPDRKRVIVNRCIKNRC